MDDEALVILSPTANVDITESISRQARVTQVASDRVMVISADAASFSQLAALQGVAHVLTRTDSAADVSGLNAQESLFVQGWLLSHQPKARKGEGLPWDAPGFEAPGPRKE
ncbi:MAG: hypothetical protein GEU99_02750 [Luteitalea sp.]|nr:hypothetical protein [Luteitalea sp.]